MPKAFKFIIGGVIFIILLLLGYDYYMKTPSRTELNQLSQLIKESEQIIVYEHSNQLDFDNSESSQRITYKKRSLTPDQKNYFFQLISEVPPSTFFKIGSFCEFAPHHTIDFHKNNDKSSSIEICFICGDIEWDHKRALGNQEIVEALKNFIKSIDMNPTRDWEKLAKEHSSHQKNKKRTKKANKRRSSLSTKI